MALRRLRGRQHRARGRDRRPGARSSQAAGDRAVIAHDAKALTDVPQNLVFDTAVAGYLLDPARRGYPLDELAEERGIAADAGDELATTAVLIHELAPSSQRPQIARARPDRPAERRSSSRSSTSCSETEKVGIKLDTKQLETVATRIKADVIELEREIWELAGEEFVIGSPQQLGVILFEKLGLSRKRRGKTGFSTDARVLQAIRDEHEIIPKIERYRELSKLAQTYLDALPELDRRRRPPAHHVRADDRRHRPPVQHQPEPPEHPDPHRDRPRDPRLLRRRARQRAARVDYSQVELRVLAHIANEQVLRDIFPRGEDVHTETASAVFELPPEQLDVGMRSKAKMVNYGIVYGLSAYGLADRLRIAQEEAQEFIDRYLERFPAVAQFMKDAVDAGRGARLRVARCSAAAARSPRSARATGRCASSASGSRSTR